MTTLGSRVRAYVDGLVVTQGHGAGTAFQVLPWQARFLRGSLAPDVGEAALTVARGAGKSTLCAGIATAFLDGEGIAAPASEITVVSPTLKQSRRVFLHAGRFLEASGRIGYYRKWDSPNVCSLESKIDGRRLECLGANPGGLHGAAPSLVLADEVAQYPHLRVDAMLAAIRTGLGKTPNSRLVMLGTRAATRAHPFSLALRTADYVQVHAAGDDDPPFRVRTWRKANPSLRYFPDLEAATRRDAEVGEGCLRRCWPRSAALRSESRCGRYDRESLLLEAATWEAAEGDAPREGRPVWGVDLGGSAASSAIAAYWPDSGRLEAVAAFPSRPTLAERGLSDGVGRLYQVAAERGELAGVGRPGRPVRLPGPGSVGALRPADCGRGRSLAGRRIEGRS